MDKLVLIDGHSILNRAFYGVPELTNSQGIHTNAVYGFLNILFKILDEESASYLAVAFDTSAPTFRHKEYSEYKGTRKPMPDALREQVPLIQDVLKAMNIPILKMEGFEADDIIGTIAKKYQAEGMEVSIISGDRDLLQLADKHIKIRIPKTSRGTTEVKDYYPEDVLRDYQVTPLEYIDVKALMGDASDNIPGVPSIGEKTATAIIVKYHSIEEAYAHVTELTPPRASKALSEHYKDAEFSKFLATIKLDVPVEVNAADMAIGDLYTKEAYQYIKQLEFKSLIKRFDLSAVGEAANNINIAIKLITDITEADSIIKNAKKQKKLGLGIIIEEKKAQALSLSFGDEAYVIACKDFITDKYILDAYKSIYESSARIYTFDLKNELKLIKSDKRDNIYDISVAAYLLNPLKDSYMPDDIARDYLNLTIESRADLIAKERLVSELIIENENALKAVAYIGYVANKSGDVILDKLKDEGMYQLFIDIEMPLIYSLSKMENVGIRVDAAKLKEYGAGLETRIAELENEIYNDAGVSFNINSPKQLGEVLFDRLGIPGGKKTKSGYSTAAGVLEKLSEDYPIVKKILEYRQLTKLNSTYAQGLQNYISEDGRIHGTFNQTITATGRISSTEPNLQNIPIRTELGSRLREVFVPKDGYVFVDADYSQIELRVLASLSDDKDLIDAYKHAADIHAITAAKVFHVDLDKVTPLMRRNAKAVNFGVVYGISAFGLSEDLSISRKEALDYINNYFKTYPGVKSFLNNSVAYAKEHGYVTTMYGRKRPIPELKSSNFMQRSFGERVAMNSPIQGTAADIMKLAMIAVDKELEESYPTSRIVLQIHDELLIEVPEADASKVKELVSEAMKNAAKLKVSLEVDAHIGSSWLAAK